MRATALSILAGALAIAASMVEMGPLRAADDAATTIKARQDLMKEQGSHMKAINQIIENGNGDYAGIIEHAAALQASAGKIVPLFPQGTGMDDGVGRTGAKPAIWEDWARFEAAAQRLGEESAKLAQIAADGDQAMIASQFEALGKSGCGGCHTPFRQKLE